ncbi:MAG: hypothetical protein J7K35_00035 [Syntrophobacterales bacterium]|nr:hypothetical protein [Syntrophobacterales bacterium]
MSSRFLAVVGATFAPCGGESPLCGFIATGGGGRTSVGGSWAKKRQNPRVNLGRIV